MSVCGVGAPVLFPKENEFLGSKFSISSVWTPLKLGVKDDIESKWNLISEISTEKGRH